MWFLRVQVKICSVNLKVKWVNTFQCYFSYFFIYDRYDYCSRADPHGVKLTQE